MTGLALPLSAEDNKPIYDAAFAHAMNMHAKQTAGLRATIYHLMVLVAMCEDRSTAKGNAQRILDHVQKLVDEAEKGAKLPPAVEAAEEQIAEVIDESVLTEAQIQAYVKAIKAKFRVYSR